MKFQHNLFPRSNKIQWIFLYQFYPINMVCGFSKFALSLWLVELF
jgi:hypothetical protein